MDTARMDGPAPAPVRSRRYDLVVVTDRPGLVFRHANRGVTLYADSIAWMKDGEEIRAPLDSIRTIRMQSGGDWKNAINMFQITFSNGRMLTVMDANKNGFADPAQLPDYRNFIRDMHRCLDKAKLNGSIRFIAGYSEGRYMVVLVCAIILGLIGVAAPLVMLFIVRDIKILGVLAAGSVMCWPLAKMVMANQPRSYNPSYPPGELQE